MSAQAAYKNSNWTVDFFTGNWKQCFSTIDNILSSYKKKGSLVIVS